MRRDNRTTRARGRCSFAWKNPPDKQVAHKILSTTIGIIAGEDSRQELFSEIFLMGVSFMLVAWVGTFMLMVA
ncbi:hypothetical protein AK51_12650 [Serratia nematodiphila DZ0503SBS1]|nr:hypothetical protein AK51_12650 [Serratia nematodiphila DZ0503SBS1]